MVIMNDTNNPPIAPTAKGYQKASLKLIINGKKPIMVEIMVKKTGLTLAFHALTYALRDEIFRRFIMLLNSLMR